MWGAGVKILLCWAFLFFFWAGLAYHDRQDKLAKAEALNTCLTSQVHDYEAICGQSTVPYEIMDGPDAHRTGVACAVDRIFQCLDKK